MLVKSYFLDKYPINYEFLKYDFIHLLLFIIVCLRMKYEESKHVC